MNIRAVAVDEATHIADIIEDCRHLEGPLLPILHGIQHAFGYIPENAKQMIADALNISRAEVHGVVSFYHDFRDRPAGRHSLKLCRAEACQAMGGDRLAESVKARLSLDWHETSADGAVTLEPVFCLGLCAQAPAAMLDGKLHARLDEDCLADILAEVRA
ncbi:formate dehydrogenase subunit gamma [Rhizobium sp. SSA_523]|uniref:formate dehydrogenase subunit gamma n=1 Tax=Rhizobium sp. SSA_523 TaxID=2952477 RepID=UPI0020908BA5|nr:formate dehydrogenase subunit gamma [Rhizobium sp. SSA_523]MCO5733610.1 formate dehydrogenase subunit gamma [Rhizobium sp. SSA_523]WKC23093.1 formate dehydrogenase subunit gamma [Rhizobium sp. SSA_523]